MLTRIRNASSRGMESVELPYSRTKENIALALQKSGYLAKVEVKEESAQKKNLCVWLEYQEDKPVITGIKRISRPGQRIYAGFASFSKWGGRRGTIVVSTSKGIMPHFEAKKKRLGGEVVCVVY